MTPQTATLILELIAAGFILLSILLAALMLRSALTMRRLVLAGTAISTQQRDRLCMTKAGRFAVFPIIAFSSIGPAAGRLLRHAAPISPFLLHNGAYLFLAIIVIMGVAGGMTGYYAAKLRLLDPPEPVQNDFRLIRSIK